MTGHRCVTPRRRQPSGFGDRPVRDLAVRTIRGRLRDVWVELGAACRDRIGGEVVHRLRVATRRASAALDAFAALVPGRRRRWFRRRLRDLRQAAGDARDLDVLAARIAGDTSVTRRGRLMNVLARQRPPARRPIAEVRQRLVEDSWLVQVDRLVDRVDRAGGEATVRRFCRRPLEVAVRRFFDRSGGRVRRGAELHRLRIDGKSLRYTFEIFAPALAPRDRRRCERTLVSLQERLGRYTDHESAAERLGRWSRRPDVAAERRLLEAMHRTEHDAAKRARRKFTKWWTPSRRRGLRKRFLRALRKESA